MEPIHRQRRLSPSMVCNVFVAAGCSSAAGVASAQPAEPAMLDRVVITGSHISQADLETALPVQIITRDDIDRLGLTTTAQVLERLPANVNGVNDAAAIGSVSQVGLASANLRGLGNGSTLVLLNGKRLANYAFDGGTVDLNSIPIVAVERIEILKDGASAIYGSDAIAGVVNFILRSDYQGVTVGAYGAATQEGGGGTTQVNLTAGTGSLARDGYNVFASFDYQRSNALAASQRSFASTGYRPEEGIVDLSRATFPANIVAGRRVLNPSFADGCAPPSSLPVEPAACGYDYASTVHLLPETERLSLLTRGTLQLNPDSRLYAEYMVMHNQVEAQIAPVPSGPMTLSGPLQYPASGLYYPTEFAAANGLSGDLVIAYRAVELGPRINQVTSDMQRAALGVDGRLLGWDYDAAVVYTNNQQENDYASGYVYTSRLVPAMATGLINPFGPSGPEGRALLDSTSYRGTPHTADGTTTAVSISASRALMALPAGDLALAAGVDARRERLADEWDPAVSSGDPAGGPGTQTVSGSRTVYAAFTELSVPIAQGLDAQLAVRYDHYSDFGSTTNPKAALRWQPMPSFLLRGSWGTGFRAPPLYDLTLPSFIDFEAQGIVDPVRCPVTGNVDDCDGLVLVTFGGNPDLQPETSTQWGFGFVWDPVRGLSFGADYWNIRKDDVIAPLNPYLAVEPNSAFASRIQRGPVDPAYPDLPGPIVGIDGAYANVGATRTSGIDVVVAYESSATEVGIFRFRLDGTYVMQWEEQSGGGEYISYLGINEYWFVIPRWRHTLSLTWRLGPWGATVAQAYTGGYREVDLLQADAPARDVGAFATWDLQATYSGFKGWQLAAGIRNLFDTEPPFSSVGSFQAGYAPQFANPLGRIFYARASVTFQ